MTTYLNSAQAAEIIGCHPGHVSRMVTAGELVSAMKLPGQTGAYLFRPDDVYACKAERDARKPGSAA